MNLDELEKLCNEATLGPWQWEDPEDKNRSNIACEPYDQEHSTFTTIIERDGGVYPPNIPTCEFIIAARTHMPKLVLIAQTAYDLIRRCQCCDTKDLEQALQELEK